MNAIIRGIAEYLYGDAYTVEVRQFTDGTAKTIIKHTEGWSATNYITVLIWFENREVWVEYYEDDVRRTRDVYPVEEFDFDTPLENYLW